MKRFFFLAITCFALIIASCSSDDDDDISTTKNYLKVKGVEYDLNDIGHIGCLDFQIWPLRNNIISSLGAIRDEWRICWRR